MESGSPSTVRKISEIHPTSLAILYPVVAISFLLCSQITQAQGFPNIERIPGELLAGPVAPEQGRTAIIAWHGDHIVTVPEAPGSQVGADVQMRVVSIADPENPDVTILPAHTAGFHAHGYYQTGAHLFVGPYCVTESIAPCSGGPDDRYYDSLRIGGPGQAVGTSPLRPANIDQDTGLLLGSYQRAGAQSPWGLNDFWTYNPIGGDAWLAVRRTPGSFVYDWSNGGAATGPAIRAQWDHLALTGVTGFPFIMGNILIWASDQAGSGVAAYDISDLSNPILLDVLKEGGPGGYWPEIYGHYIFFPRRDGEGGPGSQAGFMIVDFSDPTDLRVVANRNLTGSNQYVNFQDEYAFMNNYKIDMRTFEVVLELETIPGVIDTSQFALPVGNLVVTGGYGLDGPGLAIWAHQAEPDTRAPYVAYHVPTPDQINYPLECPITLSIPETLQTETIMDGVSLILRPVGGAPVPTWHAFGQGKLLTVTPHLPLLPDTTYEMLLTSAILDAAGNGLEPYTFRFSTGDGLSGGNQPPSVTEIQTLEESLEPGQEIEIAWSGNDPEGGEITYRVDFGDGTPRTDWSTNTSATHTYTEPGHYQITVQARDASGAISARTRTITVVAIPTATASTASGLLVLDQAADRLYVANPDSGTVTALIASSLAVQWESRTGRHPSSIARDNTDTLWVTCRDEDRIDLLEATSGALLQSIPLPYGARPAGIAATPNGNALLVACEGNGQLRRFAALTRAETGNLSLGPTPRAIAITHDATRALVTRFISTEHAGHVYDINLAGAMSLTRTIPLARNHAIDSAASGRGVPNYLAGIRISPDGLWAWIAAKKDNTNRGNFFGPLMTPGQDSTVRAEIRLVDLTLNAEATNRRLDLDNSDSPSAITFSPLGDYAFVALQGNAQLAVIDVLDFMRQDSPGTIARRLGTGLAPQSIAIHPTNATLFTADFLGRTITRLDASAFLSTGSLNVPVSTMGSTTMDRLHAEVLAGKRIFYHASDPRMSAEGYISCATCHLDGAHDGRTWDFTNRGEGFRNTTDLRGRAGMWHGNVHWSANFD